MFRGNLGARFGRVYTKLLGLKYVNERGTVHGDLEVRGVNTAPSYDFGLSFIAQYPDTGAGVNGALGVYHWKAPECLAG